MKKKIIMYGTFGFPIGIAISYIITVIISIFIGDGNFYPVTENLIKTMGSELNAVILQAVLSGIMGAGFAMASVIWEIDSWNIAKQTGIYFTVVCIIMFPISYIADWMPHSAIGIISYVGIFIIIFICTWLIQYFSWKKNINKLNEKVK